MRAILEINGWEKVVEIDEEILRRGSILYDLSPPMSYCVGPGRAEPSARFRTVRLFRVDTGNNTPRFKI